MHFFSRVKIGSVILHAFDLLSLTGIVLRSESGEASILLPFLTKNLYAKKPDCHSEPFFPDGLTKNLYTKLTFEILRGLVSVCPSQNDTLYFFFARGEELFS